MGNRVEDLETQVAQLQAAVDGLTEELVETKERLRQLESAADLEASTETRAASADFPSDGSSGDGSTDDRSTDDGSTVDAADASPPAEAASDGSDEANPAEDEGESDDGDDAEESDDIIVA